MGTYTSVVEGFIHVMGLSEKLKGTQYLRLLFTPINAPAKITNNNDGTIFMSMPYKSYIDVANECGVSVKSVKSAVKYALAKLTWDKKMWQDVMDYFGRLIEIDIHDGYFIGDKNSFIWKREDLFVGYVVDAVYHLCSGIIPKRKKGVVCLYDSKTNAYLDEIE